MFEHVCMGRRALLGVPLTDPSLDVEMGGLYTLRHTDHLVLCAHIVVHIMSALVVDMLFTYIWTCFILNQLSVVIEHLYLFHLGCTS
jgi:hypothetical protein